MPGVIPSSGSPTLFVSGVMRSHSTQARNAIDNPLPLTLIKMEHVQEIKLSLSCCNEILSIMMLFTLQSDKMIRWKLNRGPTQCNLPVLLLQTGVFKQRCCMLMAGFSFLQMCRREGKDHGAGAEDECQECCVPRYVSNLLLRGREVNMLTSVSVSGISVSRSATRGK